MENTIKTNEAKGFYKLSWLQRIGFGSGDLAQNLIYQTVCMYLLIFYTNVYGLKPEVAAVMFLIVRIVDVLWDPLVGAFVDKHNPKLGKYRSYLIWGGIPLTGFAILCFWNGFSGSLFYAYFTYVGLSMCYTLINVPYGALNASLTRDTNEITVLTSVRMFLANLGGLAVAYGIPILVKVLSPDGKINTTASANAWFITMTIYAVIGLALLMFCFNQTKERVVMDQEETSKVKVSDLWVEFCRNKPLRILAFFFITAFAMMAIGNSAGSYYMIYNEYGYNIRECIEHYQNLPKGWAICRLEDIVDYEQPTAYIVNSTSYNDTYPIPVLTAGKSFIIGHTNEVEGIYSNLPCIIFDDFTTDSKLVEFSFKVKSSAMKILQVKKGIEIDFVAMFMSITRLIGDTHKRYWISEYSKLVIPVPPHAEQKRIIDAAYKAFTKLDTIMESL